MPSPQVLGHASSALSSLTLPQRAVEFSPTHAQSYTTGSTLGAAVGPQAHPHASSALMPFSSLSSHRLPGSSPTHAQSPVATWRRRQSGSSAHPSSGRSDSCVLNFLNRQEPLSVQSCMYTGFGFSTR